MSTTYIATLVSLLTLGLPAVGLEMANPESVTGALNTLLGIAASLYILYGRYKAGGINAFGLRKR